MDDDLLIREQIEYYRHRAPEYDETSTPPDDALNEYGRRIEDALDRFEPGGRVLEIASGTGIWTNHLLRHASGITALDASSEMHELSRSKLGGDARVRYVHADVFSWEPDDRYDVVFFANWLSHVPHASFDSFWARVRAALTPTGRVFFVDERKDAWRNDELLREEFVQDEPRQIVRRRLNDGTTFRVVKVFWDPDELRARLHAIGWRTQIGSAGPFFWGDAS